VTASSESPPRPNRFQSWIQRLAMMDWLTRLAAAPVQAIDHRLLRWSGDRISLTSPLSGIPVARVTTTGAHSGRPRTHPLTALRDDGRYVLVGSNFGRKRSPAWVHNLRAHPLARVHSPEGAARFAARPATAEEYARLWNRAVDLYPGYDAYARRAAPRAIPIFILTRIRDG